MVWAILRKELRETLRDRRTLAWMVLVPLLLYPLLVWALGALHRSQEAASESRTATVLLLGEAPAALRAQLLQGNLRIEPGALKEEPRSAALLARVKDPLLQRRYDVVLALGPSVREAAQGLGQVMLLYDSVRQDSEKAATRVQEIVERYRRDLLQQREATRGLPAGFTRALVVTKEDVAAKDRRAGFGIGMVLPFLLILLSVGGPLYTVLDCTAGEKERGTLQTLLCAPVRMVEIITGKYLACCTVSMITTLANVLSMALTFGSLARRMDGPGLSPSVYGLVVLLLIPVNLTFSALMMAVGVLAKDFKDGQALVTPLVMISTIPAGLASIPGMELNAWTAFVPVLNIALLMRAVFTGEARADLVFLTLLSALGYVALALHMAAQVFGREALLVGARENVRGLFWGPAAPEATPSLVVALYAIVLVLLYYGTLLLGTDQLPRLVLLTQYGLILLPTLLAIRSRGLDLRRTLRLAWPSWNMAASGVLIGASAWLVIAGLVLRWAPPPDDVLDGVRKLATLGTSGSVALAIGLVALTPALCEEAFFRGLVLSGLRRLGAVPAVLATALLFALLHGSIYRLLPTFTLGVLFGMLAWRSRSLLPSIIAHAINNSIVVILAKALAKGTNPALASVRVLPWSYTLLGVGVLAVGLGLQFFKAEARAPDSA